MTQLIVARGQSIGEAETSDDVNLFYNGKFESALVGIEGWYNNGGGVITRSRETVAPVSGVGSLKVVTNGALGGQGVICEELVISAFQSNTLRLSFAWKGTGDFLIYLDYSPSDDVDAAWTGTLANETVEDSIDIVVPADAGVMSVTFQTDWAYETAATWYLDNLKLVKIAGP